LVSGSPFDHCIVYYSSYLFCGSLLTIALSVILRIWCLVTLLTIVLSAKNDRKYNAQKGNQTPNAKNDRKYNVQKGNQTPNAKTSSR
jgi:hypothetical protein